MIHWNEQCENTAPGHSPTLLRGIEETSPSPSDVEAVIRSFTAVAEGESPRAARVLSEYGRAFGEHVRPLVAAAVDAPADTASRATRLKALHRELEQVCIDVAHSVASMWRSLGYICKERGDLERASTFMEDAYTLGSTKDFRMDADELLSELHYRKEHGKQEVERSTPDGPR